MNKPLALATTAAATIALAIPAAANASRFYLHTGTADLAARKATGHLIATYPGHQFTQGRCSRVNRSHIDCFILDRFRDPRDGIRERRRWTVHVTATSPNGYRSVLVPGYPEGDEPVTTG